MKDTMMHHRQPRPTVRTRSFQRRCAKETMEVTISQKILLKHVATSQGHQNHLFQKKEKKGGYFNDMPETFCQRENQS
jgi:hypothetical protein